MYFKPVWRFWGQWGQNSWAFVVHLLGVRIVNYYYIVYGHKLEETHTNTYTLTNTQTDRWHTEGCHISSVWIGLQYRRSCCTCSIGSTDSSRRPHAEGSESCWHTRLPCTTDTQTHTLKANACVCACVCVCTACEWDTLSAPHSVPSRGGSSLVLQDVSPSTKHHRPAHMRCWDTHTEDTNKLWLCKFICYIHHS